MKKTVRKLNLHRETLHTLKGPELEKVAGGVSTPANTCGSCACATNAFDGYIRG